MNVVKVASCLNRSIAKLKKRAVSILVSALFDVPTRRLGAEEDTDKKGNSRNESTTELESPGDRADLVHGQVGAETQEDTEGGPELPCHDESTTNCSGSILGSEDGDGRCFGSHANAEQQSADEELVPVLGAGGADDREETENGSEEDCATTAEVVVERVTQPAAQESRSNVGCCVDKTDEPRVVLNAKFLRERQVGTIGSSLIPTLDSCADRTKNDGEIQCLGLSPLVENFILKCDSLVFLEAFDGIEVCRILSNQGTTLHEITDLAQTMLVGKGVDISQ